MGASICLYLTAGFSCQVCIVDVDNRAIEDNSNLDSPAAEIKDLNQLRDESGHYSLNSYHKEIVFLDRDGTSLF